MRKEIILLPLAALATAGLGTLILAFSVQQIPKPAPVLEPIYAMPKADRLAIIQPEPVAIPVVPPAPVQAVSPLQELPTAPKQEYCSRYGMKRVTYRNGHWRCKR